LKRRIENYTINKHEELRIIQFYKLEEIIIMILEEKSWEYNKLEEIRIIILKDIIIIILEEIIIIILKDIIIIILEEIN